MLWIELNILVWDVILGSAQQAISLSLIRPSWPTYKNDFYSLIFSISYSDNNEWHLFLKNKQERRYSDPKARNS